MLQRNAPQKSYSPVTLVLSALALLLLLLAPLPSPADAVSVARNRRANQAEATFQRPSAGLMSAQSLLEFSQNHVPRLLEQYADLTQPTQPLAPPSDMSGAPPQVQTPAVAPTDVYAAQSQPQQQQNYVPAAAAPIPEQYTPQPPPQQYQPVAPPLDQQAASENVVQPPPPPQLPLPAALGADLSLQPVVAAAYPTTDAPVASPSQPDPAMPVAVHPDLQQPVHSAEPAQVAVAPPEAALPVQHVDEEPVEQADHNAKSMFLEQEHSRSFLQLLQERKESCRLLGHWFGYLVQLMLGAIALMFLLLKWYLEDPQRKLLVFARDMSKQVIGSLVAHGYNLVFAAYLSNAENTENPCLCYLANFMVDAILGMIMCWGMLRIIEHLASMAWAQDSAVMQAMRYSGDYDKAGHFTYTVQLIEWLVLVTVAKVFLLFAVVEPLMEELYMAGEWLLSPVADNPKAQLVVVMVVIPLIVDVVVFLITDEFLKKSESSHHGACQCPGCWPLLGKPDPTTGGGADGHTSHSGYNALATDPAVSSYFGSRAYDQDDSHTQYEVARRNSLSSDSTFHSTSAFMR